MTVIAGYLGAGKTTLINRLLAEDHGLRLLIMVNDFGAINIDQRLLVSRDEDTVALSNGCVCCTMGADLFMAIGDALDRRPRPDHLIIEASGVADPARIANAALAEPELRYAGIVTVVDGPAFDDLRGDPLIGPQVLEQVSRADLVWITKGPNADHIEGIKSVTNSPVLYDADVTTLLDLVAEGATPPLSSVGSAHPRYLSWSSDGQTCKAAAALRAAFASRPSGLFRVKGTVKDGLGACWNLQVVGQQIEMTRAEQDAERALVGIGLAAYVTLEEIDRWWAQLSLTA